MMSDPPPGAPHIYELDGPPTAYFELPLDHWVTPNGEFEAEGHPDAVRLVQRVMYYSFRVADAPRAHTIVKRVKERLEALGGGYLWWRRRPMRSEDGFLYLRLGTLPELPAAWWQGLARDVESRSVDA